MMLLLIRFLLESFYMTIKICYEYKSCFSCLYLWILERVGQRGITSFNYGHGINLCWIWVERWKSIYNTTIEEKGFLINLVNPFVKFGWNEVNLGTSSGVFNRRPTTEGSCKFDTKSSIGRFTTDTRTSCPVSNNILIRRAPRRQLDSRACGPKDYPPVFV